MVSQLTIAMYLEGPTDERYLPVVVERTASRVLSEQANQPVDIIPPTVLHPDTKTSQSDRVSSMISVAKQAIGYHLLIVHADADAPTRDDALRERYEPGRQQVVDLDWSIGEAMVPIIPIRMTEAWMMADLSAFQYVVGTNLGRESLGFPDRADLVEGILNPKQKLLKALRSAAASHRRRRKASLPGLYEPMARIVNLSVLEQIPAFKAFEEDLVSTLIQLRFLAGDRL